MARQEQDREDLMREATALVERIEMTSPWFDEPIVAGFRRDGSMSLYLGGDPVFQFNTAGELRRAFIAGAMYRAERGRLCTLRRERTDGGTVLFRHDLSDDEQRQCVGSVEACLQQLCEALAHPWLTIVATVPQECDVLGRVRQCLGELSSPLRVASRPHAG